MGMGISGNNNGNWYTVHGRIRELKNPFQQASTAGASYMLLSGYIPAYQM